MSDDELRRRLHDIPAPTTRLDVDAAIAGARRTRRPKVAAVTAVTAGAGVLIVAPFVAPGLQSSQPMSAPGVAEDAGAPGQESGEQPVDEPGDTGASGGGDESLPEPGATVAGCLLDDAAVTTGVVISFADDPSDGVATVRFAFPPEGGAFEVDGVGIAQVTPDGRLVAAPDARSTVVDALRGTARAGEAEADAGAVTDVTLDDLDLVDAPTVRCGIDAATTVPAPVLWLTDAEGRALTVVGEPFGVR